MSYKQIVLFINSRKILNLVYNKNYISIGSTASVCIRSLIIKTIKYQLSLINTKVFCELCCYKIIDGLCMQIALFIASRKRNHFLNLQTGLLHTSLQCASKEHKSKVYGGKKRSKNRILNVCYSPLDTQVKRGIHFCRCSQRLSGGGRELVCRPRRWRFFRRRRYRQRRWTAGECPG